MGRKLVVWLFTFTATFMLLLPPLASAVAPETIQRGWRPPVELVGNGNAVLAVDNLRELAELHQVMMHNTEYHPQTQRFVDGLWASLERFDLRRFYRLLPKETGAWRQLEVYGARDGELYRVGPDPRLFNQDGVLKAKRLGDMAAVVRARQIRQSGATHYLLNAELRMGVGAMSWPAVMQASEETLRILVSGDPYFEKTSHTTADFMYRARVHAMNPELSRADVDIIAPLWASFPEMWGLLARIGQIESLVVDAGKDKSYTHLQGSLALKPDMMQRQYPELARHLRRMRSLLQVALDLHDEHGRVLRLSINSETLQAKFEAYVQEGKLLPMKDGKVLEVDVKPTREDPRELMAHIKIRMDVLGVITHLSNVKSTISYQPSATGARIQARIRDLPEVQVEGRALGFMPTALINIFLPRNIDVLMRDFLRVACDGNDGKGFVTAVEFNQNEPGDRAEVILSTAFEGLDNFLVRLGMGIVSDRVIPDPRVSENLRQLFYDAQAAFALDLELFARAAGVTPAVGAVEVPLAHQQGYGKAGFDKYQGYASH